MIQTLEELEALSEALNAKRNEVEEEINVCVGTTCLAIGAEAIKENLETCLAKKTAGKSCKVRPVGCNGLCAQGPLVMVNSTSDAHCEVVYEKVKPEDAAHIADCTTGSQDADCVKDLVCQTNIPFFTKQKKIVLENAGYIDPDSLDDYIARQGYHALFKALTDMSPEGVIEEVRTSGLRGRGGGGYPTGLKWESVAKAISNQKFVICNGDEGDPGAFMDRAIMESDPHRILEGMALCGYAVGADTGYIYVRAEYPLAVERLKKAIKEAEKRGLLGSKIAQTPFSFHVEVRLGGGAFVCGEATALITSIEGNRGNPRQKPPHLSDHGLWAQPTVLNNVETFANIAPILRNGGEWYAQFGTEKSKGTKVFALTGQVKHTGLVEVPMGMTLRELIYDVGGGIEADLPPAHLRQFLRQLGEIHRDIVELGVDSAHELQFAGAGEFYQQAFLDPGYTRRRIDELRQPCPFAQGRAMHRILDCPRSDLLQAVVLAALADEDALDGNDPGCEKQRSQGQQAPGEFEREPPARGDQYAGDDRNAQDELFRVAPPICDRQRQPDGEQHNPAVPRGRADDLPTGPQIMDCKGTEDRFGHGSHVGIARCGERRLKRGRL